MKWNLSMHRSYMLCSIFAVSIFHIIILAIEVASVAFSCTMFLIKEIQCILVLSCMLQSTFVSSVLQSGSITSLYKFKLRLCMLAFSFSPAEPMSDSVLNAESLWVVIVVLIYCLLTVWFFLSFSKYKFYVYV
jgi:hypothetical protein